VAMTSCSISENNAVKVSADSPVIYLMGTLMGTLMGPAMEWSLSDIIVIIAITNVPHNPTFTSLFLIPITRLCDILVWEWCRRRRPLHQRLGDLNNGLVHCLREHCH
jgi:hypothetical protein